MTDSVCIPIATIQSDRWRQLQPSTRCVFLAMLSKKESDSNRVEWPSDALANLAKVSLNTVARAIEELCEQGFVEVITKGGRWKSGTVYEVNQDYLDVNLNLQLQTTLLSNLPVGRGIVYFIGNIDHKVVKIGFSSLDVAKRVDALQTGCPYKLSVLKTIKGTTVDGELLIHKQFQQYRLHGEWFSIEDDLAEYLGV